MNENQIHQHTDPKQDNQKPGEIRHVEDLSLQEYIGLVDKQINSATSPEDFYNVGLADNAIIDIQSDNPRETFKKIIADLQNPQMFQNYETASSSDYYSSEEEPRRVFLKNSQYVQLRIMKNGPKDVLFFHN